MVHRTRENRSTRLAKITSATLVEDNHALTAPATLSLLMKMLAEFFELGGKAEAMSACQAPERDGEAGTQKPGPPARANVEVEGKFSAENLDRVKVQSCPVLWYRNVVIECS